MRDSEELTASVNERTAIVAPLPATRNVQGLRQTANDLLNLVIDDNDKMVRSECSVDEPRTLLDIASTCPNRLAHLDVYDLLILTITRQRDRSSSYESDKDFRTPNLTNGDPSRPQGGKDSPPQTGGENLATSGQAAGEKTPLLKSDESPTEVQQGEGGRRGRGLEDDLQQLLTS